MKEKKSRDFVKLLKTFMFENPLKTFETYLFFPQNNSASW